MLSGKYTYGCPTVHTWGDDAYKFTVGKFCSIGTNVNVYRNGNHNTNWVSTYPFGHIHTDVFSAFDGHGHPTSKGDIIIGNDVWIADNVVIMSGVTIGDGAIIANNSHVVKDVPPYSLVGGNPATFIKYRFSPDQIDDLLKIQWWDWEDQKINRFTQSLCCTDIDAFIASAKAEAEALSKIEDTFNRKCLTPCDINEHLPVLFQYAKECESVLETGVSSCVSSWAFLHGLLNNGKPAKTFLMNDINDCTEHIKGLLDLAICIPEVKVTYDWKNNLDLDVSGQTYDMVFIDTLHVYGQLKRELDKFSSVANKFIVMHDTTVDKTDGEAIRMNMNVDHLSKTTGFSVEELTCGLGNAISEFLETNDEWYVVSELTNNNGLTVLGRKCADHFTSTPQESIPQESTPQESTPQESTPQESTPQEFTDRAQN